jgi:hypothetical protein
MSPSHGIRLYRDFALSLRVIANDDPISPYGVLELVYSKCGVFSTSQQWCKHSRKVREDPWHRTIGDHSGRAIGRQFVETIACESFADDGKLEVSFEILARRNVYCRPKRVKR